MKVPTLGIMFGILAALFMGSVNARGHGPDSLDLVATLYGLMMLFGIVGASVAVIGWWSDRSNRVSLPLFLVSVAVGASSLLLLK